MGNKTGALYMVNNEMELINRNIVLGHESYNLEQENKLLLRKISETEEKIIAKISNSSKKKGFVMVMQNLDLRGK